MAFYRLVSTKDKTPYVTDGACGLYSGRAVIAEIIPDDEARARGLEQSDGFPAPGWIWWPGPVPR
jgi:hypothetical protein